MKYPVVYLAAGLVAMTSAAFAEPAKIAGTVTDVFGPRFVVETATGKVLVDIGPKGADKVVIKRGEKIEIEGDRHRNELNARRVTLADGHAYEVGKRGSWREWLGIRPAAAPIGPFGPAEAKKLATEKGYQVSGEPVATTSLPKQTSCRSPKGIRSTRPPRNPTTSARSGLAVLR